MEELTVKQVIISKQIENSENYQRLKEITNKKKIEIGIVNKGDRIIIENNVYIDVLWPYDKKLLRKNGLNNNSIVCKFYYKDFSMLFTGDIEEQAEKLILQEYKNNIKLLESTALKVGHHGSNSSTTETFLEKINPRFALIGVGENNIFGHPNDEVIKRLEDRNIKIYRTDLMGEVFIRVKKNGKIKIKKFI